MARDRVRDSMVNSNTNSSDNPIVTTEVQSDTDIDSIDYLSDSETESLNSDIDFKDFKNRIKLILKTIFG
jgi:hypothetical protein